MEQSFAAHTLAALPKLPAKCRMALVIRHSLRYPITGMENVYVAGLTPEGVGLAKDFGRKLIEHRPLGRIFSSPVSRCVDSAVAIAEGAGYIPLVRVDDRLSHILMEPIWDGLPEIAQCHPVPGEINRLLGLVLDHQDLACSLDLFVTHDTVVGALAGFLTGLPVKGEDVPQYLEGMYFWQTEGKVSAWWRGKLVEFELI
jgi:hypothetical protein